jgi:TatD DNase family protein
MLIDTHAHLDAKHFQGPNRLAQFLAQALEAGVTKVIAIGCDVASSRQAVALAAQHPQVYAAVGVHPCYVMDEVLPDWLEQLAKLATQPKVVAIGETGLDQFHAPPQGTTLEVYNARQATFFRKQLELAEATNLPVVVHQRSCYQPSVDIVQPFHGRVRCQFHCYIDTWEMAQPLISHGHRISFTGIATYPKAPEVLACARAAQAGTFMLETDSPYLPPQLKRGQRNEPAFVRHTAEAIAQARGETLETLASLTTETAEEFFRF